MDTKKFLMGTVVGGIVFFFLGYLLYGILLVEFFAENAGTATNVAKTELQWWPLIIANLAGAAMYSYIFLRWTDINTFGEGVKAATLIGFLIALSWDFTTYDTTNILTLNGAMADVIVSATMHGLVGGVIGVIIGMKSKE